MKGFTNRERRIIGAVYRDCERICLERFSEQKQRSYPRITAMQMANNLARIVLVRKDQVLKYGCDLPHKRMKKRP